MPPVMSLPFANQQPPEKPWLDPEGKLDVVDVWPTIQGEGPFVGEPAVFVRLAGCNLQCWFCDSDYTTNRKVWSVTDLVEKIESYPKSVRSLVVITGGEPFRQNIGPLAKALLGDGQTSRRRVQIETNGSLYLDGFPYLRTTLVCSPKTATLSSRLLPWINYLKYVVADGKVDPEDGLPIECLGEPVRVARPWPDFRGVVYVQPQDDQPDVVKNKRNTETALDACMRFGYRLSLQLHKIVGMP